MSRNDIISSFLTARNKPHTYKKPSLVIGNLQTLFCGKCGLSKNNEIHQINNN